MAIVISFILGIVIFISSPFIEFIQILFIPIAILPIRFITKRLQKYIKEIIAKNALISQTKADIFKGIEFVKSMRLEEKKVTEVENYNDDIVKICGKVAAFDSLTGM